LGIYIEFLLLYILLFLSGSASSFVNTAAEGFSLQLELTKIFLYYIPSIALIWYLLLRVKSAKEWNIKPCKNDLISCLITLPCLLITGFGVAFISSYIGETNIQVTQNFPSTSSEWVVLSFFCILAAYLEESFFRFYILSRRDELKLSAISAMIVSVALFSICHIYEGPWGFLNAFLSAVILAFVFLRYNALHGIAFAHGLYNIAVYVINERSETLSVLVRIWSSE
jgi:membrane protease YdiL (CAAX protease family)